MFIRKTIRSAGFIMAVLSGTASAQAQTKIIAHRGYWDCEGSAQNSLASLSKAHELNVYGSEFDVHLTSDGVAVINHDDSIQGFSIEASTYSELKHVQLSNGEKMPTLEQYLQQGKKHKGTQLILEIKPHKTKEAEDKAVAVITALVKQNKAERQTEYISFSLNICKELVRTNPEAKVVYLKGDLSPEELKSLGLAGLDYHYKILQQHPEWISTARTLGLSVNVWTVNDPALMKSFADQQVDYITTDKPLELARVLSGK